MNEIRETEDGILEVMVSTVPDRDVIIVLESDSGKTFKPAFSLPIRECTHRHRTTQAAFLCGVHHVIGKMK